MGTVMNPHAHGVCGDSVGILSGCDIKRKCVKYAINVIVDV